MTSKENQLAKEMVQLIKNIEEHTGQLSSGERIPHLEFEIIVAKIKSLYEKSVVLKYLHAHIDDIQKNNIPAEIKSTTLENKTAPAEVIQGLDVLKPAEKKSLHEKILSGNSSQTLAEKLVQKTSVKISSSISLNEKLMLQKDLFGGNTNEYDEMIKKLELFQNANDSKKYLQDTFFVKFSWDKKPEALKTLTSIIEKRFSV